MDNYEKIKIGMLIKHPASREVGIIKKIISSESSNCLIVIVKTKSGRKKWKLKLPKKTLVQKILSLFALK